MSGPLEPTSRPYAIVKIAGIELCWAYLASSYGGAIRASLCAPAYRRVPFGPIACQLGAEIKGNLIFKYAVLFMVISLIVALLGFSEIAAGVAGMAQVPFRLFLALFLASLGMGWRMVYR